MSTDNTSSFDIRIDSYQRSIIASALLTYIVEGGFQNKATEADIAEAHVLLESLKPEGSDLEQGVINDLRPEN